MKKNWEIKLGSLLCALLLCLFADISLAAEGELGFFGGISEGDTLPKIMEEYVPVKKETKKTYKYKEMVFFGAKPIEMTGTITVTMNTDKVAASESGSYTEEYQINVKNEAAAASLDRRVRLSTSFRKQESPYSFQVIKDSKLLSWIETIKVGDKTLTLDPSETTFSKSLNSGF